MTTGLLASLVLSAAGLLCLPRSPALPSRAGPPTAGRRALAPVQRRAVSLAAGVMAIGQLLGLGPWWFGVALGAGAGVLALRLPARRSKALCAADRQRLAVHADVLAACLDAGMSIGAALLAVPAAEASAAGPVDTADPLRVLDGVAALLALGADPQSAWKSAQDHPELASLAAAARRSAAGGAAFADAVREHATNLRAASADAAQRSAGRAGVAMTAPLGLCFLPAFLCLGLAPVVVGLLSTLHVF